MLIADIFWWCSVAFLGLALSLAMASDLTWRVIPNECVAAVALAWCFALLAVSFGAKLRLPGFFESSMGAGLVFMVMLVAAHAARGAGKHGVGGGDVKLLAAAALWTGPMGGLVLLAGACVLALLGHALSVLLALLRKGCGALGGAGSLDAGGIPAGAIVAGDAPVHRRRLDMRIPMGPAIACSLLVYVSTVVAV